MSTGGLRYDNQAPCVWQTAFQKVPELTASRIFGHEALVQAREQLKEAEEAERKAFAAAVAEWRRGTGPAAGCK